MNAPISITLPIASLVSGSSIIIEVALPESDIILLEEETHNNMKTCNNTQQPDIIFLHEEKPDNADVFNDVDERIFDFQEGVNMYSVNMYSNLNTPISITNIVDIDDQQPTIYDHQSEFFNYFMESSCNNIDDIVNYLQGDINLV